MKLKISLFLIIISSTMLFQPNTHNLMAQTPWYDRTRSAQNTLPYRHLFMVMTNAQPTTSADTVQFNFYSKITNDFLQFILKDSVYVAQYEITIAIKNDDEETMASTINRNKIFVNTYQETNDRQKFTLENHHYYIHPGEYTLYIELLDTETNQPIRQKEDIVLPNFFEDPFTTTEILYFSNNEDNIPVDPLFPTFPAVFSMAEIPFRASLAICSDGKPQDIEIKQTIFNSEEDSVYENTFNVMVENRIHPVEIFIDQPLQFGQYNLQLEISDGTTLTILESPFYIRWKAHSTEIPNLVQAIETIRLIMNRDEWNRMKNKPIEEQERLLEAFWKERDPSPGTGENELEHEYYSRVSFTNRNFAPWDSQLTGWETDRGRTYILYGPPSDVDNPSTPTGDSSRYEIWYYRNLQKRFVFLDKFGTGEYRLITEE